MPISCADAIARLTSLHDGDEGLIEVVACGKEAIPPLVDLLFARERSGIYEPRRRAVEALAALGAYEPLRDFLALRREIKDPVELTGEDAVINAAAHALARVHDERDYPLLLDLLRWRLLPGVIEGVGAFKRPEAIRLLIDAFAEDDCRPVAEAALLGVGRAAIPALIECAVMPAGQIDMESESSVRQRRSALRLLAEIGISHDEWKMLRQLTKDPDTYVAAIACKLGLTEASAADRDLVERLTQLRQSADWMLAEEISNWLTLL